MKIASRLENPVVVHSKNQLKKAKHMIIGSDSDLIIMAVLSDQGHLYILEDIQQKDAFSISAFNEIIAALGPQQNGNQKRKPANDKFKDTRVKGLKLDFALCSVMECGNDYLPGLGMDDLTLIMRYMKKSNLCSHIRWHASYLVFSQKD